MGDSLMSGRFRFLVAALVFGTAGAGAGCSSAPTTTGAASTGAAATAPAASVASPAEVDDSALLGAASDDADWLLPGKSYANNRYTGLGEITPQNVAQLQKAWQTTIKDDGEQEASPIAWGGRLFISTPHDNVLAFDGATGKLVWQHPYPPPVILDFAVSRGVGLENGKIFLGTQDCRVLSLDAATGKQLWNVNGCPNEPFNNTHNNWFSIASYPYNGMVILSTAGGDFGNVGQILAFDQTDGHRVWDWQTIKPDTWPGNSWQHGSGAVWGGMAIDPDAKTLYVAPGNPGPDLTRVGSEGKDLYTESIVALDVSGAQPRVKWYDQLVPNDTHDADPAMGSVLFDGTVQGQTRHLLAIGLKNADIAFFDRTTGKLLYKLGVDRQTGILTTHPTVAGTFACPNHGGGIEWNGGAYDPGTNQFLVPSTEECAIWKLQPGPPVFVMGQNYHPGPLPKRHNATGKLTAIDIGTGKVAWVTAFPYSGQGGALVTKSGLAFTSDLGGNLYAIDPKDGHILWKTNTGSSIVAPITAYEAGGQEYIALLSGEPGNQKTLNIPATHGSVLTAYRLGPVTTAFNSGSDQIAAASASTASQPASIGSAPYSAQQVADGGKAYAANCASCHGAQLQGISAPALTGPGLASSKLNLSRLRSVVTAQMPLTAPGSLKPDQYADIMAFLLSYDCVTQSPGAFPTTDRPEFKKVLLGGRSCPPSGGSGHE
jgi:alcohol dehydrogenase (cytochrome c)